MTTRQLITHGRATGYAGLHASARPKATAVEKDDIVVELADGTSANVSQMIREELERQMGMRDDDAGKRRPAAHSGPLTVHGVLEGDLAAHSGAPLLPGAYFTAGRKAS